MEAVVANDPAGRVNTIPKLINPESHHQGLGIVAAAPDFWTAG
jgi:hypothetical protein